MNESSHTQTGTPQTSHNSLLQLLVGLFIGGGVAVAAIALNQQFRPPHRTPSVVTAAVDKAAETQTESPHTLTQTPVPTETPSPTPEITLAVVTAAEIQAATSILPTTQVASLTSGPLSLALDSNFLPPAPVMEEREEEIHAGPSTENQAESTTEKPAQRPTEKPTENRPPEQVEPAPETSPVLPTMSPERIESSSSSTAEPHSATSSLVIKPVPVPTSAFLEKAHKAQELSERAQVSAEKKQADQYASTSYQEGLRLYTLGLEASEKELYQTAARRFAEAAGAFIKAESAAHRITLSHEMGIQARSLAEQARGLVAQGAYQQAEQVYLAYLQKVPQDAQISYEYGEMLADNLSYSRGIQVLNQTLKMPNLPPEQRARIYWRFAEGHHRAGNLQIAIQSIRLAIQYDPRNSGYISLLNQYQYEASERQRIQQQRQGSQQNLIQNLTGSVLDGLIH